MSRGCQPPTNAASLISLALRLEAVSMGKWANFLPVGKDFTISVRNFLPVGNGLRNSPPKVTRYAGHNRGKSASTDSDFLTAGWRISETAMPCQADFCSLLSSVDKPTPTTSEWRAAGEAEAGSAGEQPVEE